MVERIRVTKEFTFETAHALDGYDGKCKDIHGHSYSLSVTLIGTLNKNISSPKCGMVVDFSDIKSVVNSTVIDHFDHYLILRNDSRFKGIEAYGERIRYVSYQPTCENMLLEIVHTLNQAFTKNEKLISVRLRETASGFAEWYLTDN